MKFNVNYFMTLLKFCILWPSIKLSLGVPDHPREAEGAALGSRMCSDDDQLR
jgi:hypothetical protein